MEFSEKLKRLMEGKTQRHIADMAGIGPTVLNKYLHRGSKPRADFALHLADVLDVPVGWLVDDEQGWPPPDDTRRGLEFCTDTEILLEAGRRYWLAALRLREQFEAIKNQNWPEIVRKIAQTPIDEPLEREVEFAHWMALSLPIHRPDAATTFDVKRFAQTIHDLNEKSDEVPHDEIDIDKIVADSRAFYEGNEHLKACSRLMWLRQGWRSESLSDAERERKRAELEDEIARLDKPKPIR